MGTLGARGRAPAKNHWSGQHQPMNVRYVDNPLLSGKEDRSERFNYHKNCHLLRPVW